MRKITKKRAILTDYLFIFVRNLNEYGLLIGNKKPITEELNHFIDLFNTSLEHQDGLLSQVLMFIKQRSGKRMRPMLMLLIAKAFGCVSEVTQHAAIGLELLHTASLVHDDVVDESGERRGQASVNAFL